MKSRTVEIMFRAVVEPGGAVVYEGVRYSEKNPIAKFVCELSKDLGGICPRCENDIRSEYFDFERGACYDCLEFLDRGKPI